MAYRDDRDAMMARIAALEQQAERAERLEQRVRELEEENRELRSRLAEARPTPAASAGADVMELDTSDVEVDQGELDQVYFDAKLVEYVGLLVEAARSPSEHSLSGWGDKVVSGASPEDVGAITEAAKRHAFGLERKYVTPADIKSVTPDILRPHLILTRGAEISGVAVDELIAELLDQVEIP